MSNSRRDFLKQIFAAGIFTATCPHVLLGRVIPEFDKQDGIISGIYNLKISKYSELSNMWGSVRLAVEGIPPEYHYPAIIVARVDPDYYQTNFTTVSESCPHEGYPIELLNDSFVPDPLYECVKGHGSLYLPDGTFYFGVSRKDLLKYKTEWDGGDNLYIEIDALQTSKIEEKFPNLYYMSDLFPNPADDFATVKYGFESEAYADISIYDLNGNKVKEIVSGRVPAGHNESRIELTGIPVGFYVCKMIVSGRVQIARKLNVVR